MPPAREWLRRNHQKRFFLLVQGYDTHCPFAVPRKDARFDPGYKGKIDFTKCYWTFERTRPVKRRIPSGVYEDVYLLKTKPTEGDNYEVMFFPDDVKHMIALYDGEIFNADAWVGGLLDDVKEFGLEKNTIIVIFSDHGDMFGKHGRFMRGGPLRGTFYDDVLRVPLIVFHPEMEPRQVESFLQTIDLAPTLLDLMGLPAPTSFAGKSARQAATSGATLNSMVFAGSAFTPNEKNPFFHHNSIIYSVRNERWKLIWERVSYSVGTQDHFELYDVKADPQELKNLVQNQPQVVSELKAGIENWLREIKADAYLPKAK
jgi:arylsulfatase A-like enzyme